jgi:peptidoglycan hydrolase-like protein with peptidoglycan-binding domain
MACTPQEAVVAVRQKRLKELGYHRGPVDGIPGPRTRKSYPDWVQDHPNQSELYLLE